MNDDDFTSSSPDVSDEDSDLAVDEGREPEHWADRFAFPDDEPTLREEEDLEGEEAVLSVDGDAPTQAPGSSPTAARTTDLDERHKWFRDRWDDHWVVPNVFLRCALFAAARAKHSMLSKTTISGQKGFTIVASGPQLNQADLDVWCAVANLEDGKRIEISAHRLLSYLDRNDGSSDRAWLLSALRRLSEFHVEVSLDERVAYIGPLIKELSVGEAQAPAPQTRRSTDTKNRIVAQIDPAMSILFAAGFTQLPTSWRRQLRLKPLANWIVAYYRTHQTPRPIKVATLRRFSGSGGRPTSFERKLRDELSLIESYGYLRSAKIIGELVEVERGAVQSEKHPALGGLVPQPLAPVSPSAPPNLRIGRASAAKCSIITRLRKLVRRIMKRLSS